MVPQERSGALLVRTAGNVRSIRGTERRFTASVNGAGVGAKEDKVGDHSASYNWMDTSIRSSALFLLRNPEEVSHRQRAGSSSPRNGTTMDIMGGKNWICPFGIRRFCFFRIAEKHLADSGPVCPHHPAPIRWRCFSPTFGSFYSTFGINILLLNHIKAPSPSSADASLPQMSVWKFRGHHIVSMGCNKAVFRRVLEYEKLLLTPRTV